VTPVGCPAPTFAGAGLIGSQIGSQYSVQCYLNAVSNASIADFAHQGLDSSNAYCGPFPCSVLQTNNPQRQAQASFGGINPAVGSNVMFFPAGRSKYTGIHLAYAGASGLNPLRRVRRFDVALAYTLSRYRTNIAEPNGSGGIIRDERGGRLQPSASGLLGASGWTAPTSSPLCRRRNCPME